MFPRSRNFLKFAAAGAFVALSASTPAGAYERIQNLGQVGSNEAILALSASTPAADEMLQNLGPVGPNEAILAKVGSTRLIAFFEPGGGRCALNAVVWDDLAADPGKSAKRVRVIIGPGEVFHIDTAEQQSLHLQCGSNAATIAVIDADTLAASGITAQPPGQPVRP